MLVLLVTLALGLLYGALTTERGTAYAWQAAVRLLGGKLGGTLEGGTLATGVRLRDVRWRSLDGSGTDIQIDRAAGRWALARDPWRFTVDYLHVGTVDARVGASSSTQQRADEITERVALAAATRHPRRSARQFAAASGRVDHRVVAFRFSWTQRRAASRGRHRAAGYAVRRGDGVGETRRRTTVSVDRRHRLFGQGQQRGGAGGRPSERFAGAACRRTRRDRHEARGPRAGRGDTVRRGAVATRHADLRSHQSAGFRARCAVGRSGGARGTRAGFAGRRGHGRAGGERGGRG